MNRGLWTVSSLLLFEIINLNSNLSLRRRDRVYLHCFDHFTITKLIENKIQTIIGQNETFCVQIFNTINLIRSHSQSQREQSGKKFSKSVNTLKTVYYKLITSFLWVFYFSGYTLQKEKLVVPCSDTNMAI